MNLNSTLFHLQVVPDIEAPSQRWPRFSNRAYNYSKPVFNPRDPLTGFIVVLLEYDQVSIEEIRVGWRCNHQFSLFHPSLPCYNKVINSI